MQEGYLRMRNRVAGSVDLNWVDDIICEWKVFFVENLIYGGLLLLSPYMLMEKIVKQLRQQYTVSTHL